MLYHSHCDCFSSYLVGICCAITCDCSLFSFCRVLCQSLELSTQQKAGIRFPQVTPQSFSAHWTLMCAVAWSHTCKIFAFVFLFVMKDFKKQDDSIKNYFILKHTRRQTSLSAPEVSRWSGWLWRVSGQYCSVWSCPTEVLLEVVVLGKT